MEDESSTVLDEEVAVAQAMGQRLDLKALQDQVQALDLSTQAAKASGLPVLSFRASITQQNDLSSQIFRKDSQLYSAGLALTWEGFSPFRSRARAAELKATAQSTAQILKSEESAVAQEVRTTLSSAKEARERVGLQQLASIVAEEQARIARLAYREGTLSAVEAQDAELALTNAHYSLLRARLDLALAKASLRLALGE
jgi:outer membrane protein TolC